MFAVYPGVHQTVQNKVGSLSQWEVQNYSFCVMSLTCVMYVTKVQFLCVRRSTNISDVRIRINNRGCKSESVLMSNVGE